MTPLRLGTRGSALALAQAGQVAQAVTAAAGRPVELVPVTTRGDTSDLPLEQLGREATGVFVVAVRRALLTGEVDLVVHSLKDLPTAPADGLTVAAVPPREDPRDALCARDGLDLVGLPEGATVGTGAPRRVAQLRALRPDLTLVPVRGNVDTRLRRVADGDLDAVVLARAGLARLGRLDAITEVLDPLQVLPAPGQGALAVECRTPDPARSSSADPSADAALVETLRTLDDPATRAAVEAERSLLAALEAGCTAPVGAYADVGEDPYWEPEVYLRGAVVAIDGSHSVRMSMTGPAADAAGLGRRLAADLLADGAADLLGERVP
ncbi:MAG: hydroxymethylbilane synthase [Candidatus Nanopelagicales bacterium]